MNKKILIATGIYPPDIGGPATYLPQFINFLKTKGFSAQVLTFSDFQDDQTEDGVRVFRISRKNNAFIRLLKYSFALFKISKKADLIYLHDVSLAGLALLFANFFRKIRYVVRIGGDSIWEQAYQRGMTSDKYFVFHSKRMVHPNLRLKKIILKKIASNSKKIIVPSLFLKKAIATYGISEEKIEVVHNAIDLNINKNQGDVYRAIDGHKQRGSLIFISNGRLVNWKNFDHLIGSFEKVKNAKLFIIGSGPEKNSLLNLIQGKKLEEKVFLLDKIKRGELLKIYDLADAFVLLSIGDTFSFAALEALLVGARLILAREGALPEIFGEFENQGVAFVDLDNKRQLIELLNNPEKIGKINHIGIEKLKKMYNYQKHLNDVYKIINDLI